MIQLDWPRLDRLSRADVYAWFTERERPIGSRISALRGRMGLQKSDGQMLGVNPELDRLYSVRNALRQEAEAYWARRRTARPDEAGNGGSTQTRSGQRRRQRRRAAARALVEKTAPTVELIRESPAQRRANDALRARPDCTVHVETGNINYRLDKRQPHRESGTG